MPALSPISYHSSVAPTINTMNSLHSLLDYFRSFRKPAPPKRRDRILDRDDVFFQSKGDIALKKRVVGNDWRYLYYDDWFHSLVNAPTMRLMIILLGSYMILTLLFAIPFYYISKFHGCALEIDSFRDAFAYSLETTATIGYGTADIFFDECWSPVLVIALNVCIKLVLEAFAIGVIYCRLSNPVTRSKTIIFSDKAVIRRIRGKLYFMIQLCELRKHQLVEAHIRLYAIRRDVEVLPKYIRNQAESSMYMQGAEGLFGSTSDVTAIKKVSQKPGRNSLFDPNVLHRTMHFQTCRMRLNHPNDELDRNMLLMLPQVVVHEMDAWSPLMAPPIWISAINGENVRWAPPVFKDAEGEEQMCDDGMLDLEIGRRGKVDSIFRDALETKSEDSNTSDTQYKSDTPDKSDTHDKPMSEVMNGSFKSIPTPEPEAGEPVGDLDLNDMELQDIELPRMISLNGLRKRESVAVDSPPHIQKMSSKLNRPKLSMYINSDRPSIRSLNPKKYDPEILSSYYFPSVSKRANDVAPRNHRLQQTQNDGYYEDLSPRKRRERKEEAIIRQKSMPKSLKRFKHAMFGETEEAIKIAPRSTSPTHSGDRIEGFSSFENLNVDISEFTRSEKGRYDEESSMQRFERNMIQRYMKDRKIEIFAVLEGVDAPTGGVVQARHSWTHADIDWNKSFAPCVYEDEDCEGAGIIDFSLFHDLIDASYDAPFTGPIPSYV